MSQHRALTWLHSYGRRYPWAWEAYARLLADPPMQWPPWCWCPLAGAYAVISRGAKCTTGEAADVGILGALAAWRATQGIYRVHPTLLAELLATPISGDVPVDVLQRLPEWCVYVETTSHTLWGLPMHGFWAYLEYDSETARRELRLVVDIGEDRLGQIVIHLGGSLLHGLTQAVSEARIRALRSGHPHLAPSLGSAPELAANGVAGIVSVLLYLCADDAEIDDRREPPPKVVRGAKRPIMPAAKAPVLHPTGVRLGSALDAARARAEHADGTGSAMAPHVRRAHWHTYWTGPREGERRASVRWLSPILVGFADAPSEPTVRPVRGT